MNKIRMLWIRTKSKIDVVYIPRWSNFIGFIGYAFGSLSGKYAVMDGREVSSNGGFKYYQMEITKLPCSSRHVYA